MTDTLIGFISSDKFDVNPHGLRQLDQKRKKVAVVVVCRGQE